jgi:hypothetical protein
MAAGRMIFPGMMPARDENGDLVPNAKAYVYENESDTLSTLYSDEALTTTHANPVEADSSGVWPIMWADTADAFTVALTDEDGAPIAAPWDNVSASVDATLASADLAEAARISAQAAEEAAEAAQAQTEAIAAELSGAPFQATSTTSLSIGTGAKSLTLAETGKLFALGQTVVIARTSAPTTQMTGIVAAFNSGTGAMTVEVAATGGAGGPFTDWTVALSSAGGVLSVVGETGVITRAELMAAVVPVAADITDFTSAASQLAITYAVVL